LQGGARLGKNSRRHSYNLGLDQGVIYVQSNAIRAGAFIGILVLLNVLSYEFGWGRIFY
jgi:hypothetical protein